MASLRTKLLASAAQRLRGLSDAQLEALFIVNHVLRRNDEPADLAKAEFKLNTICQQRRSGLPLAYCLGTQGFYKNEFVVNDSVLIPRPETELLVELLLQSTPLENARVAEVGVGSGCVSISYLLERPDARGWATDVSPGAISVAQQNAAQLQVQPRLTLLLGSVLEPVAPLALKFHAIVSNPPYLVSGDAQVAKDVHQHEPHSALYVPRGMDPLFVAKAVADQARALLLPGGILGIEIDSQCHADALEMLQSRGYRDVATVCDLAGLPRVVWGVRVGL